MRKKTAAAPSSDPFESALSLLERLGPLSDSQVGRLARVIAARMDPRFLLGFIVAGPVVVVDGRPPAKLSKDEIARGAIVALDQLKPLAALKGSGRILRGLKTTALAATESVRTSISKW